ncbi:MAG: Ig-like domain-containing protein [Ketobacter sp.]
MTSPLYGADADGSDAIYGDAIQWFMEQTLAIPAVARDFDAAINERPFLIPQATSHALTTVRDKPLTFTLKARHYSDPDLPEVPLQYGIIEGPYHGTLKGTPPELEYIPDAGFTGLDLIRFEVDDGEDGASEGRIDFKVAGSYTLFESGQVRPLALNSDGTRLYALNTPDGRLEIFDVSKQRPVHLKSVAVGLEPVAIALRNDNEAWVVNTLSDSVSVVDVSTAVPYVKHTLQVGDEPQDIVFAGKDGQRAFIATAHRGQNSPSDFAAMTPGIGRADIWSFDADSVNQGNSDPLTIVTLFGMPPRGLAVSPDGSTVYAGIYKSGNQTASVTHNFRAEGKYSTKFGKPGVKTDAAGVRAPNTGLIVKYDGEHWVDLYGKAWDQFVHFNLPDYDVFEIDADAALPEVKAQHAHVGTSLFNLEVNPKTGAVYVSNMEARNELMFEGKGERSDIQTLRGRFIENRITVIKNGEVLPRDLNTHLNDARPEGSEDDNARSLAYPLQMQIDDAGETLYLAAYGSSKVGIFDVDELESHSFTPSASEHIEVTGGGPSGLALDQARNRLFVLTRFDNSISVIDTVTKAETSHTAMYNPEPDFIVKGRPFLYDARFSSGRGDSSCASCHLFGDNDGLAWDLGDPDNAWTVNPRPYFSKAFSRFALRVHHPMKGPMATQSFRGLEFQGPMHWRGDRTGAVRLHGESLEKTAFKEFRVAYVGLLGRNTEPSEEELNLFADFVLQLRYPPNPNRQLDDTLRPSEAEGSDTFFNVKTTGFKSPSTGNVGLLLCNDCHELNPDLERFGSSTLMSFEGVESSQDLKISHLRSLYTKVGMFGQQLRKPTSTSRFMGDQLSGFGFAHAGADDTIETFLTLKVFHIPEELLQGLIDFMMVFPTGLAPITGQQVTLNAAHQDQGGRLDLMVAQALAHTLAEGPLKPQCELVAQGTIAGASRNWLLKEDGRFHGDKASDPALADAGLRRLALQAGNSVTFSCVPFGNGKRIALDRDEDGVLNRDDGALYGKPETNVAAANPLAPKEVDELVDAVEGGFEREFMQKLMGDFPSFRRF